jgi:hypothetical protein
MDMEKWRHGYRDIETWRHRHGDMETLRNGDMEAWRHGGMKTFIHGDMETSNGKRKPRRFSLIHLPFAHCANGSLSFVCSLT